MRSFYKLYEKGKNNKKIYKGSIVPEMENTTCHYLGGVSVFIMDEDGNICVEKRADTKLQPGRLDLVSGHIDNNETPMQAMIREYVEELHEGDEQERENDRNEAIENLKKLDELDLIIKSGGDKRFFVQFYFMKIKEKKFTMRPQEVKSIEWVPMEEVFKKIRQGETRFPYDKRFERIFDQVREMYNEMKKRERQCDK